MNKLFLTVFLITALFGVSLTSGLKSNIKRALDSDSKVAKRFLTNLVFPNYHEELMEYQEEERLEREFQEWMRNSFEQLQFYTQQLASKLTSCEVELYDLKALSKSNQTQS